MPDGQDGKGIRTDARSDDPTRLLEDHGLYDGDHADFHFIWTEGVSADEAAVRLGADIASAMRCRLTDLASVVSGMPDYAGSMLAGPSGGWTQVLLFGWRWYPRDRSFLSALSRDGGRMVNIEYNDSGVERFEWVVDGTVVTAFLLSDPEERWGTDPHALDPLMAGLRFGCDDHGAFEVEDPVTIEESITSALRLAGRITGKEIDSAWFDSPRTLYFFTTGR